MTPIFSLASEAGKRHFSTSFSLVSRPSDFSALLCRVPITSRLYIGQSLGSSETLAACLGASSASPQGCAPRKTARRLMTRMVSVAVISGNRFGSDIIPSLRGSRECLAAFVPRLTPWATILPPLRGFLGHLLPQLASVEVGFDQPHCRGVVAAGHLALAVDLVHLR